jgi:hypothetical protein
MNKPTKRDSRAAGQQRPAAGAANQPLFLPPLRPRRKLMIGLGILLLLWLIVLLAAYFKTVYPLRHEQPRAAHTIIEPTP